MNSELQPNTIDIVKQCILYNNTALIEPDENAVYKAFGHGTEVGLITFLQENNVPV